MKIYKYQNIQIYMERKMNVKNVKEYGKKVHIYIYIHMKNFKVRSNQDFNNERNKQDKEKIFNKNKYIGISIKIYKDIYIYIYIQKNIQIYKNLCTKIFM